MHSEILPKSALPLRGQHKVSIRCLPNVQSVDLTRRRELKPSFSFQRMNFDGQSITDPGSTRMHGATLITPRCAIGLRRPVVSAGRPGQCDEEARPGHDPKLY